MTTDSAGLTPDQLEALRQLCLRATPGPWYAHNPDDDYCMNAYAVTTSPVEPDVSLDDRSNDHAMIVALTLFQAPRLVCHAADRWDADAEFIAAARTALPTLLEQLASLTAERNELQDTLHRADALRYRILAERDALRQQADRYRAKLIAIAEWRHDDGCEVAQHPFYECTCAGPGPWTIARDALAQEDVP